jgi:pyrimidine-nucleoside phosphorylase
MNVLSAIEAKRDGAALSEAQLRAIVDDFTAGRIPDCQMSAFLMAVFFRGLNPDEKRTLTLAMRDSGDVLSFPDDPRPIVDKHSTGGIGDKVSLPLAPLLASLGFRVPMISGRGLGITGGTLDKLESIPGFQTLLPPERIVDLVQSTGCVICGQTDRMIPADKKIYALRDVTATVPSIPLITASILSKKLAENLDALILDAKFGAAAFMKSIDEARELARSIVDLGKECGVNTRAILTDMNTPIGRAAGNWLEVRESVACLESKGPNDLRELTVECAAHLLAQTGKAENLEQARNKAAANLANGAALAKWNEMLEAQGADMDAFQAKLARPEPPVVVRELHSARDGFVTRCDARVLGEVIRDLGGGRLKPDAAIHHDVGVDDLVKPGEKIQSGEVMARIHAVTQAEADVAEEELKQAIEISPEPVECASLICEVVE